MAEIVGHALSMALGGFIISDPDHAAEGDVKKDVVYGNEVYTGTYDPGGTIDIRLVDVPIQLEDDPQ